MTECLFYWFWSYRYGKIWSKEVLFSQFTPPNLSDAVTVILFSSVLVPCSFSAKDLWPLRFTGVYAGGREWHNQTVTSLWWGRTRLWYLNTLTPILLLHLVFLFALKPDKFKIWDFLLSVPADFMATQISIYDITMLLPCLSPVCTTINWMPSGREKFARFAFIPWVFFTLKAEVLHDWLNEAGIQLSSVTPFF